ELARDPAAGVSLIELRQLSRTGETHIPDWAAPFGVHALVASELDACFRSGFSLRVPLMDTTVYLGYLAKRLSMAGGSMTTNAQFQKLENVPPEFDLVINCAGIGARELVYDADLEPHRGQVAIVPKPPTLSSAIVCDDA